MWEKSQLVRNAYNRLYKVGMVRKRRSDDEKNTIKLEGEYVVSDGSSTPL